MAKPELHRGVAFQTINITSIDVIIENSKNEERSIYVSHESYEKNEPPPSPAQVAPGGVQRVHRDTADAGWGLNPQPYPQTLNP